MVRLKIIPTETNLAKGRLSAPIGLWYLVWSEEGIVRITSMDDINLKGLSEGIVPDWLQSVWDDFWKGLNVDVAFCTYKKPQSFTLSVYEVVYSIPFGSTLTYKEVASLAGNPRASRAVGIIMKNNPWALFLPCHRVIGSDGGMRGYGGPEGIELKKALLNFERRRRLNN